MPLVDHEQMEEEDKAVRKAVEVVAAVTILGELRPVQGRIAAELLAGVRQVVVSVIVDSGVEEFHADDGVHVEDHLKEATRVPGQCTLDDGDGLLLANEAD